MDRTYNNNPPDYNDYTKRTTLKLMSMEKIGITPNKVAKKIYKAAKTRSWCMRYNVGLDAKLAFFLRRTLLFRFFRWILRQTI